MDTQTELTLAEGGDPEAIGRLLVQCQPMVNRYAQRLCEAQDVDEAVQDALWILSRRIGALRAAAAMSSWLFQVVRRLCLRMRRRHRTDEELGDNTACSVDDGRVADLRIDLARAIAALPENYRQMLLLVDVLGHNAQEAAVVAGTSVDAAKSRLHRARALVRQSLAAL